MYHFETIGDDFPRRTFFEEEEEEAELESAKNLVPPIVLTNRRFDNTKPELVIVGCSAAACLVLDKVTRVCERMGSLLLPEISLAGNTVKPSLSDQSANMWSNPKGSVVVIPCQYTVPGERAVAWVRGMTATLQPSSLLVIGSMQAANFRGPQDAAEETLLFSVATTVARERSFLKDTWPPLLPPGNLISDLPSALLQHAECHGMAATGWISVDFYTHLDLTLLRHLSTLIAPVLSTHGIVLASDDWNLKGLTPPQPSSLFT